MGRKEGDSIIMGQQLNDDGGHTLVAVAIDKDRSSQNALKWALENIIVRGQTITLVHVNTQGQQNEASANNLFLPFRCFCTRKDVKCNDVVVNDGDVAKAIIDFVSESTIEKLVVGAPSSKGGFVWRMKTSDISNNISKGAPDFCTVYVISKGKVSSIRNATRPAPTVSHLRNQVQTKPSVKPDSRLLSATATPKGAAAPDNRSPRLSNSERDTFRSPFARTRGPSAKPYGDYMTPESDISFVSTGRPSVDQNYHQRLSSTAESFDHSFELSQPSYPSYSASNSYYYSQGESSLTSMVT